MAGGVPVGCGASHSAYGGPLAGGGDTAYYVLAATKYRP